jgi:hypothetical protein
MSMRRITSTIVGMLAIIVILYMRNQAARFPAPLGLFNLVTIVMIIIILVGIVRVWLRGY